MKLIALLLLCCSPILVLAQTPSRALKIGDGFADYEENKLLHLTNTYFSGDWMKFQSETIKVLQELQFKPANNSVQTEISLDFRMHYYSVVFVYEGPDRKEEVLRFLVHTPSTEPYVSRIPGIKAGDERKLYELFLTLNPQDELISTYFSVKEKSVLESQLPRFLKLFDPKVLSGLLEAATPRNRIYAVLSRIDLPFSRASITVKDVVQKEKKVVEEDFKLFNRPFTRFSFGLVSSIIISSSDSDARATIQSGDLTIDPLRGHMPMGILNIHPSAYDAESDRTTWSERFCFFVGGVLAPEFGISGGVGFQLIRGFSVNAGVGLLLIDTLKEGESIGEAPLDEEDPFEYATSVVLFAGVGYNF